MARPALANWRGAPDEAVRSPMALPRIPKQDAKGFRPLKKKEEREHDNPA